MGRVGAVALAALVAGCSGQASRLQPDAVAPEAAQKAMELYDANGDGFLDAAELEKCPGLRAALKQIDTSGSGKISAAEIATRIQFWKDSGLGRTGINVMVRHHGVPLPGAKVVFVPESFLGDNLRGGEGVTNDHGLATISAAGLGANDLPGLSPGFYRVQITKEGADIPAKYNTATTLGQEVAPDVLRNGVHFNLTY
jgi:hypothetical protein